MLIPIRTDYRLHRRPWVNYALIAANVLVFVAGLHAWTQEGAERIDSLMLQPHDLHLMQFFTSVFLHGSLMHLLGNMLFLWVFGNAVNDRLGHIGYLAFYLAGGIFACLGYLVVGSDHPVLGASGAISAVTGAYLVLLPRVRVTVLMWFVFITTFEMSSLFFLMFQFIVNLFFTADVVVSGQTRGVAYSAHTAGYVFGMVVAIGLLATRLIPRDMFDLLGLISSRHRRSRYRRMVGSGYNPFGARGGSTASQPVQAREVVTLTPDNRQARELQLRRDIADLCRAHRIAEAVALYMQLLQIADDAILSQQNQLDIANYLMSDKQYPAAADAYERFLRHYPSYPDLGDIYLMLGIIYGRYLQQYDRAEQALGWAQQRLSDQAKIDMARTELGGVQRARRGS